MRSLGPHRFFGALQKFLGPGIRGYVETLRHLRPRQLFWLVAYRVARPSRRPPSVGAVAPSGCGHSDTFIAPSTEQDMELSVSFLSSEQTFERGLPDWRSVRKAKLWRYNLHYFDYLMWPCVSETRKAELIDSWIEQNPFGSADAWEPYPVSLRIVNWVKHLVLQGSSRPVPDGWLQSFALQAAWLERNLERHLLANHYLKNAKALTFAGLFLRGPDAERWLKMGTQILREQMDEQFLSDGGHYELSPMYHCVCLEDLLDTWNYAHACRDRVPNALIRHIEATARRALDFLAAILMPDDEIPLFNDSAFGIAPTPRELFDYANRLFAYQRPERLPPALADSGYFRLGAGDDRMIIDCGPVSPAYQPGHTHCDMLSYELAFDGRPIVVDPGVHDYEESPERAWCRSTRAHNTVSVDGEEQSEVWGVFRVARRACPVPGRLYAPESGGGMHFVGGLEGFPRVVGGIGHRRQVWYDGAGIWTIRDEISGCGHHMVDSRVHLHSALRGIVSDDRLSVTDSAGLVVADLEPLFGASLTLEPGLYFPRFGAKLTSQVARLSVAGRLPLTLGYRIRKVQSAAARER